MKKNIGMILFGILLGSVIVLMMWAYQDTQYELIVTDLRCEILFQNPQTTSFSENYNNDGSWNGCCATQRKGAICLKTSEINDQTFDEWRKTK